MTKPLSILLIYHFFHPDTVVSARLFADLAAELARTGCRVTVFTGNRLIRGKEKLPPHEVWRNVEICRFSRPAFAQGGNLGRLCNSAILQCKWLAGFWRRRRDFDAVVVGTDPQFAYLMFPYLRLMNRRVRLVHWAFDLYPEAILVNSPRWMKIPAWFAKPLARFSYHFVNSMVDIGACMRERLRQYHHAAAEATLTPWALVEPAEIPSPDPAVRRELFGEATLGLLYSGTVGYAHDLAPFIALARECRRRGVDAAFCFAGYGNQYQQQLAGLTAEDTNIRLAGFASEEELEKRLAAADIHLISLRQGWEGVVVPSKFFGALAIGRPVLFSGPENSAIAVWCRRFQVGKRLDADTLAELAALAEQPKTLEKLRQNARQVYGREFSREVVCRHWRNLLESPAGNDSDNA